MFDHDIEEGLKDTKRKPFLPDLHLKTAIRVHKRRLFKGRLLDENYPCPGVISHEVATLSTIIGEHKSFLNINSETCYPVLWSHDFYHEKSNKGTLHSEFVRSSQIAKHYVEESLKKLYTDLTQSDREIEINLQKVIDKIQRYHSSSSIETLNRVRYFWSSVRTKMSHLQIDRSNRVIKDEYMDKTRFSLSYTGNFCICNINSVMYLLEYDQVLLIADTSTSRYLTYLACELLTHLEQKGYPAVDTLNEIYKWGDDVLLQRGNDGYKIIKLFEALCTSHILDHYEPLDISKNYGRAISKENSGFSTEIKMFKSILRNRIKSVNELFEIFGLYRHFGHPTVNEAEGCKKMCEYSRKEIKVDSYTTDEVYGAFVLSFITEFIKQHNRWPKTRLESPTTCSVFEKVYNEQLLSVIEYAKKIPIVEWSRIRFGKELDFDYHEDFTDLLLDTSISPYKRNWTVVYHPQLLTCHPPKDVKENRRLLEEVLRRPSIDVESICNTIMERRVPDSWKIIGLHSKEREIKIAARLFAMLVLEMRMYFCVTEQNLKKVFNYTSGQTMTMSETELIQHLYKVTKSGESGIRIPIIISIDFTKWNNAQRHDSNIKIFRAFDDLYGTPGLYTYTHEFFSESSFYLSSNLRPPSSINRETEYVLTKEENPISTKKTQESHYKVTQKPPRFITETETTWVGQEGGCEGLRQKGWTSSTNALLKLIEHLIGIESIITGQGDNQVVVALIPVRIQGIPNDEYIEKYKHLLEEDIDIFLATLSEYSTKIGLEIKTEESWVAIHHFNFGKEILYKGCFNTGVLKKLSRTYQSISESYPSLANRLASISTATHAACGKSFSFVTPLYVQIIETSLLFLTEVRLSVTMRKELKTLLIQERVQMSQELIMFLIQFPLFAGGYPISNPLDFLYRGHPDNPLVKIRWLLKNKDLQMSKNILEWIMSEEGLSQEIDPQMIIQDPYALNFVKAISSQNIVKNMLITTLGQQTTNKDLQYLMKARSEEKYKAELDFLFSLHPCSPRVLNDILRNTPEGAANMFINTFGDMRTIKGMLTGNQGYNLIRSLTDTDLNQMSFLIKIFKRVKKREYRSSLVKQYPNSITGENHLDNLCTRELSQRLRDNGFKKPICHVTTPHPDEQFKLYRVNKSSDHEESLKNPPPSKEKIIFIYIPPDNKPEKNDPNSMIRGNEEPYCGSKTSEKRGSKLIPFDKANRPLKAAQNLARLLDWIADPGTELYKHIEDLIRSRTDTPIDILTKMSGVNYGGDLSHRFADVITKHACRPNMRVNVYSCIYISSDTMGKYGRGLENWTIVYQSAFLYALSLISQALEMELFDSNTRHTFFLEVDCQKCFLLLEEEKFDTPNKRIRVHQLKRSKVIFMPYSKIKDDIPRNSLDKTTMISATEELKQSTDILSCALASSLYGEIITNSKNPLRDGEGKANSLRKMQVLTFSTLSRCNLYECSYYFGLLWFYDNLYNVIKKSIDLTIPVDTIVKIESVKIYRKYWKTLIPFLATPEMSKKLRDEMNLSLCIGESLASKVISVDILAKESSKLLAINPISKLPLYFCPKGLSFSRVVANWCAVLSVTLNNLYRQNMENITRDQKLNILQVNRILQRAFKSTSSEDGVDLGKFLAIIEYPLTIMSLDTNKLRNEDRLLLSIDGPEVWFKNPKKELSQKGHTSQKCRHNKISLVSSLSNTDKTVLTSSWRVDFRLSRIPEGRSSPLKNSSLISRIKKAPPILTDEDSSYNPSYLSYQGKLTGKTTSCHYKYIQLLLANVIHPPHSILCLADGSGGVSKLCLELWATCTVRYNSLINPEHHYQHRVVNYVPPELTETDLNRVTGIEECIINGGDLRDNQVITSLARVSTDEGYDLMILDLETSYHEYNKVFLNVLKNIMNISKRNCKPHMLIIKTFWRSNKSLAIAINFLLASCDKIQVQKPHMSEPGNGEIFLVGKTSLAALQATDKSLSELDRVLFSEIQLSTLLDNLHKEKENLLLDFTLFDRATRLFDRRGYPYNLCYHVTCFLGQWVDYIDFAKRQATTLSRAITLCTDYLITLTKSKEVINQALSHSNRLPDPEGREPVCKDSSNSPDIRFSSITEITRDTQTNMEFLYNLITLRRYLLYPNISIFLPMIRISYDDVSNLLYRHDPVRWNRKFGRSFQAIKGHLRYAYVRT